MRNENPFLYFEVFAGIAIFATTLLFIIFIDIPLSRRIAELNNIPNNYNWSNVFLALIFPSLIAYGSYIHAFKQSKLGLGLILILGGMFAFFTAISVLIGTAFEGHPLIGISPGFFAFMTIVLALYNTLTRDSFQP